MQFKDEQERQTTSATNSLDMIKPEPENQNVEGKAVASPQTEDTVYPSGIVLVLLMLSIFISMFLVALDRLIVSTAIPSITDEFHAATDIGWYGSSFLLTSSSFQLLFGKVYAFFNIKWTLISTILLFEVGSALSGAAPSSVAFIVGRTIAGLGAAGVLTGCMMSMVSSVPLHKRPMYQGIFGAAVGVASAIGPLLGGVFTSKVTWRWCFYINLPLGGVGILVIFFLLQIPDRRETKLSLKNKLAQLDFYGTSLIVPGVVCLLLALQWGGLTYAWNNGRIIALLVLAGLLIIGFVLVQIFMPKTATISPRIFKQRSIISGFFSCLCQGSHTMIFVYYLPVWFQAIQGVSAIDSGIRLLPSILSMVISMIFTGTLVRRVGYYAPFMIFGTCLASVGAGLLTTIHVGISMSRLIGYQVVYGWGLGAASQAPNMAAQTVLPKKDISVGTSLMFFTQTLGGTVFISVGQNVLQSELLKRLSGVGGFSAESIRQNGVTSLADVPESIKSVVLNEYNESIRVVFRIGLILSCISILASLAMEWRSTRQNAPRKDKEQEQ